MTKVPGGGSPAALEDLAAWPLGAAGVDPAAGYGWALATMTPSDAWSSYSAGAGVMVCCRATALVTATLTKLGTWVTSAGASPSGVCGMALWEFGGGGQAVTGDMSAALSSAGAAEGTLTDPRRVTQGRDYYLALLAHLGTEPGVAGRPAAAAMPAFGQVRSAVYFTGRTDFGGLLNLSAGTPFPGTVLMYGRYSDPA